MLYNTKSPGRPGLFAFLLLTCRMIVKSLPPVAAKALSVLLFVVVNYTVKAQLTADTLTRVSSGFVFTEGPAVNKRGDIYFTDQPRNQIWKYAIDGKLSLYMDSTGRSNGLYFDKNGNLLACADKNNELWSISPDKRVRILLKAPAGLAFNGPNDLRIDPKGGIYFTDPYYQRDYWLRKQAELPYQGVYYLANKKSKAVLVDSMMVRPNGIVGTADGKIVYVADIGAGKTYRYRVGKQGKLTDKTLFVEQGSDGMTLDEKGNLYISGNGVTVYNPAGKQVQFIPVPSKWVGNLCFGGARRNILFITASESVYTIPMLVRGIE